MTIKQTRLLTSLMLAVLLVLSACSSSGDTDDETRAQVLDISLEDAVLARGEETLMNVDFSFAMERVFDDHDTVSIAIRLPRGISYVSGSSRVDSRVTDNNVTPVRLPCVGNHSELLLYNLSENDLRDAVSPDGPADGRLRADIIADIPGAGTGTIEARAGYNISFTSCDESFSGEELELITIFP